MQSGESAQDSHLLSVHYLPSYVGFSSIKDTKEVLSRKASAKAISKCRHHRDKYKIINAMAMYKSYIVLQTKGYWSPCSLRLLVTPVEAVLHPL